jgi:hypothetical protein
MAKLAKFDRRLLARFVDHGIGLRAPQMDLQRTVRRVIDVLDELANESVRVTNHVVCSVCRYPFVLRRAILVGDGGKIEWVFQPDCPGKGKKCKGCQPVAMEGS